MPPQPRHGEGTNGFIQPGEDSPRDPDGSRVLFYVPGFRPHLTSLLQIRHLRTSVYHPQTDGLMERFNKTLKSMLKKVMEADGKKASKRRRTWATEWGGAA